jgi:hypothetical protein
MDGVSIEEWELVSAFEVNPTYLDAADPWPYTDALFRVEQGSTVLNFAVSPAYRDVRIVLEQSGVTVYELNATSVLDVKYRRDGTREFVDVVLGEVDTLTLSVKPAIRLDHRCVRYPHD